MNYNRLQIANKIARRVFKAYHGYYPDMVPEEEIHTYRGGVEATHGVYRKTKVPCSDHCCGNPRKYEKGKDRLTVQERKAIEAELIDAARNDHL